MKTTERDAIRLAKQTLKMIMFNLGKDEENWHSYISAGRNVNC